MVYPNHYLLQFGGPCGDKESWTCGIRMANFNVIPSPFKVVNQAILDDVAADVATWFVKTANGFASSTKLGFVKFNQINSEGHYADPNKAWTKIFTGTLPSGVGSNALPSQCSVCVTFLTGGRGASRRGRIYLPPMSSLYVSADGRMGGSVPMGIATEMKTLLNAINNWPGLDFDDTPAAAVVSKATGEKHFINEIRVGRVVDTQRRRRESSDEEYVTVSVTA